jgi:hypothetical protein
VNLVNLVRTRIFFKYTLQEREISHKLHQGYEVHQVDRLATFQSPANKKRENRFGMLETQSLFSRRKRHALQFRS